MIASLILIAIIPLWGAAAYVVGARSDAARMRAGCPACGSYKHTIYRCPRASGTRLG